MKPLSQTILLSLIVICLACSSDEDAAESPSDNSLDEVTQDGDVTNETDSAHGNDPLPDAEPDVAQDTPVDSEISEEVEDRDDGSNDQSADLPVADAGAATITPAEGGTLTTPDGIVSIVFPSGAVTSATEVSVATVAVDDVPWTPPGGMTFLNAYQLEPSGLVLDEPATITVTRSLEEHVHEDEAGEYRAFIMLSYSESADPAIELLSEADEDGNQHLRTRVDLVNGEVNAIADIHHFSWVVTVEEEVSMSYYPGDLDVRADEFWPTTVVFNNHSRNTWEIQEIAKSVDLPLIMRDFGSFPANSRSISDRMYLGLLYDDLRLDSSYLGPDGRSEWHDSPWLGCDPGYWDISLPGASHPEASQIRVRANFGNRSRDSIHMYPGIGNLYFYTFELPISLSLDFELITEVRCTERPEGVRPRCDPSNPQTEPLTDFGENMGLTEADLCAAMVNLLGVDDEQPTQSTAGEGPDDPGNGGSEQSLARGAVTTNLDGTEINDNFGNTFYPCGEGDEAYTVCPDSPEELTAGDYVVAYQVLHAPIPLTDDTNHYQYGFIFDRDGDDANNYSGSLPYDFFGGSDRWYEVLYTPEAGWSLKVSNVTGDYTAEEVTSDARIIIDEAVIALVVPASEFAVPDPAYRVTAFRHTGDWGLEDPYDWNGDMSPPLREGLAPFEQPPTYIEPIVHECPSAPLTLVDHETWDDYKSAAVVFDRETDTCTLGSAGDENQLAIFNIDRSILNLRMPWAHELVDISHGFGGERLPDQTMITARILWLAEVERVWEITFYFDAENAQVYVDRLVEIPLGE